MFLRDNVLGQAVQFLVLSDLFKGRLY